MEVRPSSRRIVEDWFARNEQVNHAVQATSSYGQTPTIDGSFQRYRAEAKQNRSHRNPPREADAFKVMRDSTLGPRHDNRPAKVLGVSRLAERFDLDTPFRHIEARGNSQDHRGDGSSGQRKRQRSPSTSSYLELAATERTRLERNHASLDDYRRPYAVVPFENFALPATTPSPAPSQYERRPRRKTREDKYEAKPVKEQGKPPKKKKAVSSKRPWTGKAGVNLLHEFSAKNVTSDRLTLKPSTRLGLFTKGRASSPVRRRGLPDLSFSEMGFLRTCGEAQESQTPHRTYETKRTQKEQRASETHNEISRFFDTRGTSPLRQPRYRSYHMISSSPRRPDPLACRDIYGQSDLISPSKPPAGPVTRSFLGFGLPGRMPAVSDDHVGVLESTPSPSKSSLRQNRSLPTTYFPWSTSPNKPPSQLKLRTRNALGGFPAEPAMRTNTVPSATNVYDSRPPRLDSNLHRKSAAGSLDLQNVDARSTCAEQQRENVGNQDQDKILRKDERSEAIHDQIANLPSPLAPPTAVNKAAPPSVTGFRIPEPEASPSRAVPFAGSNVLKSDETIEMNAGHISTLPEEFAADLDKLLGSWKDKVKLPIDIVQIIRDSCGAKQEKTNGGPTDMEQTEEGNELKLANTDQPREMSLPAQPTLLPGEYPEQDRRQKEGLAGMATSSVAEASCPIAKGSSVMELPLFNEPKKSPLELPNIRSRSQNSWTDPSLVERHGYHNTFRSPGVDSTYGSCGAAGGSRSIYEHQVQLVGDRETYNRWQYLSNSTPILTSRLATFPYSSKPRLPTSHHTLSYQYYAEPVNHTRQHGNPFIPHSNCKSPVVQRGVPRIERLDWENDTALKDQGEHCRSPISSHCGLGRTDSLPSDPNNLNLLLHTSTGRDFSAVADGLASEMHIATQRENYQSPRGHFGILNADQEEKSKLMKGFWKPNLLY